MTAFLDLGDIEEDRQINKIGQLCMSLLAGHTNVFFTDAMPVESSEDGFSKADRYIHKLLIKFPSLEVVDKFFGPIEDIVSVRIKRK
jgi:hypothetical protein